MKDPKSVPAGSDEEPAAPNPEPGMMPAPPGYQFPSRKARRHAELTGMIPIIVPETKAPGTTEPPVGPVEAGKPTAVKSDGGPDSGAEPTDTPVDSGEKTPAAKTGPDKGTKAPVGTKAAAGTKPSVETKAADETKAATGAKAAEAVEADKVADNGPKKSSEAGPEKAANEPAATPGNDTTPGKDEVSSKDAASNKDATPGKDAASGKVADANKPAKKGYGKAAKAKAVAESEADAKEPAAPAPVSAAAVTGIPVVPAAQSPVATLPKAATEKAPRTPKAGRDLPAAISVGVGLLVLVIGTLLFYPLGFVALATIFACVGVWEVCRAIAGKGIIAPLTPIMVGALAMPVSAYLAGSEGLLFAFVASSAAAVLWRSLDPAPGAIKSILAGLFSLMWIPFLLSFVFLMIRGEQGPTMGLTLDLADMNPGVVQVMIMLFLVVANDTFGYLVGVLFGKHPMAPKISPKKSWEGFAGSLGGATLVAIPATVFLLDQHWWVGLALAIGMVFAGTGGDFAESMVKRELGVKDMSNLLPGHGGVMDRLDSILFAAPVAYAIFTVLGRF